jgi:hypothetical protein
MVNEIDTLVAIKNGAADAIRSISKSDGYYNDWGTVQEFDLNKQAYPAAEIYLFSEENDDQSSGSWCNSYKNLLNMTIVLRVTNEEEYDNPYEEGVDRLFYALSDLKKKFGTLYTISDRCDRIMYTGYELFNNVNNDIISPAYLETKWSILYYQMRTDPSARGTFT